MTIPLQKHTLNLREGDFDFIASRCAGTSQNASQVVRRVVSTYVDALRRQAEEAAPSIELDP